MVNEDISLTNLLTYSDEMEIFDTKPIEEVVNFYWDNFGRKHHVFGFILHVLYVVLINFYVHEGYI